MARRRNRSSIPRNVALGGALAGGLIGYALTDNPWAIIVGTLGGMVVAPLLTGTSPTELRAALFHPAS